MMTKTNPHQQIFKIYIKEENFLEKGLVSLIGPFYSQYIYYCLKQSVLKNSHLFSYNFDECSNILLNSYNYKDIKYDENKIYSVLNFNKFFSIDSFLDKKNVNIINFSKEYIVSNNCNNFNIFPPFDYSIYVKDEYDSFISPKYNSFNFSVFCNELDEIEELFKFWIKSKIIFGNIYCFYYNTSKKDQEYIKKYSNLNHNKNIIFCNLNNVNFNLIMNALKTCVFSLHYSYSMVYPFWAARFKCYPIVLSEDVFSSYVKYIKNKEYFIPIVEGFWNYPKELATLIKQLEKIKINKFNLSDMIIKGN